MSAEPSSSKSKREILWSARDTITYSPPSRIDLDFTLPFYHTGPEHQRKPGCMIGSWKSPVINAENELAEVNNSRVIDGKVEAFGWINLQKPTSLVEHLTRINARQVKMIEVKVILRYTHLDPTTNTDLESVCEMLVPLLNTTSFAFQTYFLNGAVTTTKPEKRFTGAKNFEAVLQTFKRMGEERWPGCEVKARKVEKGEVRYGTDEIVYGLVPVEERVKRSMSIRSEVGGS